MMLKNPGQLGLQLKIFIEKLVNGVKVKQNNQLGKLSKNGMFGANDEEIQSKKQLIKVEIGQQSKLVTMKKVQKLLPRQLYPANFLYSKLIYSFSSSIPFKQFMKSPQQLQSLQKDQNIQIVNQRKLVELQKLVHRLQFLPAQFIQPLNNSKTYNYASYLLFTLRILTELGLLKRQSEITQSYFRAVKNSFKQHKNVDITNKLTKQAHSKQFTSKKKTLTPRSVVQLLQSFSQLEFEGDQSLSLEILVSYVEENYLAFTQQQIKRFQLLYQKIMVEKAIGPVQFRPFKIQKIYKTQKQRKIMYLRQLLGKIIGIQYQKQRKKQIIIEESQNKNWIIVKIPSKNLVFMTSIDFRKEIKTDDAYQYIYDLKQVTEGIIAKIKRNRRKINESSEFSPQINVLIRNYTQSSQSYDQLDIMNNKFTYTTERGLVYKQIKEQKSQLQKLKQMRQYSLKDKIAQMKQLKKSKNKKKQSNTQTTSLKQPTNQSTPSFKQIDLFQTIKYQLKQLQTQQLLKINGYTDQNGEKIDKTKIKRKQRIQLQKQKNINKNKNSKRNKMSQYNKENQKYQQLQEQQEEYDEQQQENQQQTLQEKKNLEQEKTQITLSPQSLKKKSQFQIMQMFMKEQRKIKQEKQQAEERKNRKLKGINSKEKIQREFQRIDQLIFIDQKNYGLRQNLEEYMGRIQNRQMSRSKLVKYIASIEQLVGPIIKQLQKQYHQKNVQLLYSRIKKQKVHYNSVDSLIEQRNKELSTINQRIAQREKNQKMNIEKVNLKVGDVLSKENKIDEESDDDEQIRVYNHSIDHSLKKMFSSSSQSKTSTLSPNKLALTNKQKTFIELSTQMNINYQQINIENYLKQNASQQDNSFMDNKNSSSDNRKNRFLQYYFSQLVVKNFNEPIQTGIDLTSNTRTINQLQYYLLHKHKNNDLQSSKAANTHTIYIIQQNQLIRSLQQVVNLNLNI